MHRGQQSPHLQAAWSLPLVQNQFLRAPGWAAVAGGVFAEDLPQVATLLGQVHLGQAGGQPLQQEVVAAQVGPGGLPLHPESGTSKDGFKVEVF